MAKVYQKQVCNNVDNLKKSNPTRQNAEQTAGSPMLCRLAAGLTSWLSSFEIPKLFTAVLAPSTQPRLTIHLSRATEYPISQVVAGAGHRRLPTRPFPVLTISATTCFLAHIVTLPRDLTKSIFSLSWKEIVKKQIERCKSLVSTASNKSSLQRSNSPRNPYLSMKPLQRQRSSK